MKKLIVFFLSIVFGLVVFAQPQKPFKFALITDTHVGSPNNNEDLYRTVRDINSLTDIAFVIVSGDVIEFGSYNELRTAKCLLDDLNVPYYAIPGNHDSNWSESGTNDFLRIFGGETFGFTYNGYKFIGMAMVHRMVLFSGNTGSQTD